MGNWKKLLTKISNSSVDESGKVSHTRITSYIILVSIIVSTIVFLGIDISNLILSLREGELYEIPLSHITIFGMVLSHHLVLLGIKKYSETKKSKYEELSKGDDKNKIDK